MATTTRGVILVGHGGIPKGCQQELITKLKRLEGQRRAAGVPMSAEEHELDIKPIGQIFVLTCNIVIRCALNTLWSERDTSVTESNEWYVGHGTNRNMTC